MKKVAFIGAGGHSRAILPHLDYKIYDFVGFFDDKDALPSSLQMYDYLGPVHKVKKSYERGKFDFLFITIGDLQLRSEIYEDIKSDLGDIFINIIAKNSIQNSDELRIGTGNYIAPYSFIGSNVKLDNNNIVNTGAIIEHDCRIGSHNNFGPRTTICGAVSIKSKVNLGASSTVLPNTMICDEIIVGAMALVTKDLFDSKVYIGIPAK